MRRRNAIGLTFACASLAARPLAWGMAEDDPFGERLAKSVLDEVGVSPWWDKPAENIIPLEFQGDTTYRASRVYGKIAVYVSAQVRYENGTPFLGWDSAQGGKTANVVSDILVPGANLAERVYLGDEQALLFTAYHNGEEVGIQADDLVFRALDPDVAYKQQDGTLDCTYIPGDRHYAGCQTDSFADDGFFTQDFLKLIQTSEPAETTKVAKRTFDALVEGTIRCGIDQQLIPQMNQVYESNGLETRIDDAQEFAETLIRALIRDYHARAGVPVQRQIVEVSAKDWEPPRTATEAFTEDVQTFFNKFELGDEYDNPAFCLDRGGAPAFHLDVAMTPEQLALGGLKLPLDKWDQVNVMFSEDPRFTLHPELFAKHGIVAND